MNDSGSTGDSRNPSTPGSSRQQRGEQEDRSSGRLRVLIVDDSPTVRRHVRTCLVGMSKVERVVEAEDGEQGLRMVVSSKIDVVLLDLEMPRLNGYSFLRIVSARHAVPVLVLSSHSGKQNVFRALEFGAIDFIPKPETFGSEGFQGLCAILRDKLRVVGSLRSLRIGTIPASPPRVRWPSEAGSSTDIEIPTPVMWPRIKARGNRTAGTERPRSDQGEARRPKSSSFADSRNQRQPVSDRPMQPSRLVGIVASTGGPMALLELLGHTTPSPEVAIVVAIHMPEKFTEAFAARLNRATDWQVVEARSGQAVRGGQVLLAPGGHNLQVVRRAGQRGAQRWTARLSRPYEGQVYVPSGDMLLHSVANAAGKRAVGVVLTGMGRDGANGLSTVTAMGGMSLVHEPDTAVLDGMPKAAIQAVPSARVLTLGAMATALSRLR